MVAGLSSPHRAARRGRLMPLATWSFPLQRGYCSSSNTVCGVTARTIRCVWYKQRRLGCQAFGGCRTAGQEFWGMQLVILGKVCLATTPPPPPAPLPPTWEWSSTPWRNELQTKSFPVKGRASVCRSESWVSEAILLASPLLPTPIHKETGILIKIKHIKDNKLVGNQKITV